MEVLSVMSQLCGDFLQRRISKEIIPIACKYLIAQANTRLFSNNKEINVSRYAKYILYYLFPNTIY